jgi:hypothetical protein
VIDCLPPSYTSINSIEKDFVTSPSDLLNLLSCKGYLLIGASESLWEGLKMTPLLMGLDKSKGSLMSLQKLHIKEHAVNMPDSTSIFYFLGLVQRS